MFDFHHRCFQLKLSTGFASYYTREVAYLLFPKHEFNIKLTCDKFYSSFKLCSKFEYLHGR